MLNVDLPRKIEQATLIKFEMLYLGGARYFFKVRKVYKLMHFPLEVIFTGAKSEELIDGERSYGLSKVLQPVPSEIDTNWTN